jgi:DNA-binding transcriptional LysR family regulator
VLHRFAAEYPRMRVQLLSSFTRNLREEFARGEIDVILTTEDGVDRGGETLATRPVVWIGAPGGQSWRQRPLRLAFEARCIFRQAAQTRLDAAGIPWEMAVESNSSRAIEATVSADLAVNAMIEGTQPQHCVIIQHGGALPELGVSRINMYAAGQGKGQVIDDLAAIIRQAYGMASARAA